jgi:hypothetical protein
MVYFITREELKENAMYVGNNGLFYNIYDAPNGLQNVQTACIYECNTIEQAINYFGLSDINKYIETEKTIYNLFDAQTAKNRLFIVFIRKLITFSSFGAMLTEFLNNHTKEAFKCAKIYLQQLLGAGQISQEDYDLVCGVLMEQNIDLKNI